MRRIFFLCILGIIFTTGASAGPARVAAIECVDPPQTEEDIACMNQKIQELSEQLEKARSEGRSDAVATYERTRYTEGLPGLLDRFARALNSLSPFIIGLAILVILWGIFNYISHAGDEEKRAEARMFIVWGVIFLFVMLSIWGLVNVVSNTFRLNTSIPDSRTSLPRIK